MRHWNWNYVPIYFTLGLSLRRIIWQSLILLKNSNPTNAIIATTSQQVRVLDERFKANTKQKEVQCSTFNCTGTKRFDLKPGIYFSITTQLDEPELLEALLKLKPPEDFLRDLDEPAMAELPEAFRARPKVGD